MKNINYEYFKENFTELFNKYPNKYIVIKNKNIIGIYETFDEAYKKTVKTEKLGTFIIQQCIDSLENMAHFSYNNVGFM
jgi:hypothetical protein